MAKWFLSLLLFLLTTFIFQNNLLNTSPRSFYEGLERNSQAHVLGKIIADKVGMTPWRQHLGWVYIGRKDPYQLLDTNYKAEQYSAIPYPSQYGIFGIVFSTAYNKLGIKNIELFQYINSGLLAFVVIALSWCFCHIINLRFSIIFYFSIIGSPWIVAFAKDLYWAPYLWFLPALISCGLYLNYGTRWKWGLYLCLYLAILLKCLAGYEYISAIVWFAMAIFLLAPFLTNSRFNGQSALTVATTILIICCLGFVTALLIHASTRGDNVLQGLQAIWQEDVKRRTYGNPAEFSAVYRDSLSASAVSVIHKYLYEWETPIVWWIPGRDFVLYIYAAIGVTIYKCITHNDTAKRDAAMLLIFSGAPISWYVLGKSHSFIHVHLNFGLWYLGFVAAVFYVIFEGVLLIPDVIKRLKAV